MFAFGFKALKLRILSLSFVHLVTASNALNAARVADWLTIARTVARRRKRTNERSHYGKGPRFSSPAQCRHF